MFIDPLDLAVENAIKQAPVLVAIIAAVIALWRKVTKMDKKITRIETKLTIHLNAKHHQEAYHESVAGSD